MLIVLLAAALAHPASHRPARHDIVVTVADTEVVVRATVTLPEELLTHDPVWSGTAWLAAGLELRAGDERAAFEVTGTPTVRRATGRVTISEDGTEIIVADATLLTEHNELRWRIEGSRVSRAEGLDEVFDGRRRRSLRDQWLAERPRQITLTVDPVPTIPWWTLLVACAALTLPAGWLARQRALASTPPSPR